MSEARINGRKVIQPRPITAEIKKLSTPDDYLVFVQTHIWKNFRKLAEVKKDGLFTTERAEAICADLAELYTIYLHGGTIGEKKYLPNDLPVHNFNHVAFQTALMSDIATELALMEPHNLPQNAEGNKIFNYSHFVTQLYTSMFHETGYLRDADTPEANYPGAVLVQTHEERGVEFAENAHIPWQLSQKGVDIKQLRENILATKMAKQNPRHFEKLSDLTLADLSHIVDLASYAVAPNYVPHDITNLWMEFQSETPQGESLAKLKYATTSQTRYVVSGFMLPGESKPGQYRWGEGPSSLFRILNNSDPAVFTPWIEQYEENIKKLQIAETVLEAPKAYDALLTETSLDPYELRELAQKYGVLNIYQAGINEAIARQTKEGTSVFERLPTYFVRRIFQNIEKGSQKDFLVDVITYELDDMADQNIHQLEVKLTPLAWYKGPDEPIATGQMVDTDMFIEAYASARHQFVEMQTAKGRLNKNRKYQETDVRLGITLRREDDEALNEVLLKNMAGSARKKNVEIHQIDLVGDERKKAEAAKLAQVLKLAKQMFPHARIGLNLGQIPKSQPDGDKYSGFQLWKDITEVQNASVSVLLYPTELMINTAFAEDVFRKVRQGLEVVVLPVESALQMGYKAEEIVTFIRRFLKECPDGTLRLQSINNFMESLTLQIVKLATVENGLTTEELRRLGVELPQSEAKTLQDIATGKK